MTKHVIEGSVITRDYPLAVEETHSIKQTVIDAIIKTGAGIVHTVTFSTADAAPTAGTIAIYDGVDAGGTLIFTWTLTTAVFFPVSILLDALFSTGLFVAFTTTADVSVTVTYR